MNKYSTRKTDKCTSAHRGEEERTHVGVCDYARRAVEARIEQGLTARVLDADTLVRLGQIMSTKDKRRGAA